MAHSKIMRKIEDLSEEREKVMAREGGSPLLLVQQGGSVSYKTGHGTYIEAARKIAA